MTMAMDPVKHEEESTTYEGRLPQLEELLRWGGRPGVKYLQAASTNMGAFQRGEIELEMPDGELLKVKWSLVREIPVLTGVGPKGDCDFLLMAYGTPILGADPVNGRRMCGVDPDLLEATGILEDEYAEYLRVPGEGKQEGGDEPTEAQEGGEGGEAQLNEAQRLVMEKVRKRNAQKQPSQAK